MPWSEVPLARGSYRFQATRWSLIATARRLDEEGTRALDELCSQYWPPLYAFARRRGHTPESAQDATQDFFLELLDKSILDRADASRGRFRNFLLTCFSNHLSKATANRSALKRGGAVSFLPIDGSRGEQELESELIDKLTPEQVFARRWALTVIEVATERLRAEYVSRGREKQFDLLRECLQGEPSACSYKHAASNLGMREGAIKVTVHRMRRRLAEILLEEVGQTIAADIDPREELRDLFAALALPESADEL